VTHEKLCRGEVEWRELVEKLLYKVTFESEGSGWKIELIGRKAAAKVFRSKLPFEAVLN
jgi:hypothetical protein